MHRIRQMLIVTAFIAGSAGASSSAASILISNLEEATRNTTNVMEAPGLWAAQSFLTDGSSYTLISVETLLWNISEDAPSIVAELHADNGSTVGTLLATFSWSSVPTLGPGLVTLTPGTLTTLDPNTTYWIVLGVEGPGTLGWSYAEGNGSTGPGSLGAYGYSSDNGATWGSFGTENPYQIAVNVDLAAVPEPSTVLMVFAGLIGIATASRGRRRRS